jgi:ribokinase
MTDVIVLGSLNMDLVIKAQRAPAAGETLPADEYFTIPGGKGANQAAAIARLGVSAALVGRVGKDGFGQQLLENLIQQGVDISRVRQDEQSQTGLAWIVVEKSGENRILLMAGANARVNEEDVDQAEEEIGRAKLLVCHFETLQSALEYSIETAYRLGVPFLLNPAPAFAIPDDLLRKISFLVLNETEAGIVSGLPVSGIATAEKAGEALCRRGAGTVIVTLGARGAVVVSEAGKLHVPGFPVQPVDTTAAGDAFIGGFAAAAVQGYSLLERVRYANACGALAVTRLGAQTSLPNRAEVQSFLERSDPNLSSSRI